MSGSHYFTGAPEVASDRRPITVSLPDLTLELTTDTGVFSRSRLDPCTRILLEHAPQPRCAARSWTSAAATVRSP